MKTVTTGTTPKVTTEAKVLGRKYAKTILKLITKNGFKSYHQTTRELETVEKRTNICAYQIRGIIIGLNEAKLIDIVLPTKAVKTEGVKVGKTTKGKTEGVKVGKTKVQKTTVTEVMTAKEAKAKFNVVNLRARHDKLLADEGYTKTKGTTFPFDVTYTRTVTK